jgi:hypothetical protein
MPGVRIIPQHAYDRVEMVEQSTSKTIVSCVLAMLLIISFTAAPAAALTQDDVVDDDSLDGIDADTSDSDGSDTDGVEVRIVNTNSPVETGETLNVKVDVVTNDGGTVALLIDGEKVDEKGFAPGQEDRATFQWETSFQDAGEHNATVRSGADSDSETVQVEPGYSFPEERCTNVPKEVNKNVPYGELPSQDQLPEEIPNPVPPFLTPRSVGNLIVGATPNQCEIQDPNDPSVDPTDPQTEPSAEYNILRAEQYKDGGALWITYRAGLSEDEGPAVSGSLGAVIYSGNAYANPNLAVNDGEKAYAVDPEFDGDDSTAEGSAEASAPFGTVGGEMDCAGGECQPDSSGIPKFQDYPAIPAPIWDGED